MEKNKDKKRKQFVGSSSFSEEDDATPPTTQQKNRKKLCLLSHGVREKKYQKSWEETYKWIEESSKGSTHFKCRVCAVDLKGGLTEVQRHDANKKHRKNQKACPMEKVSIFLKTEQDHQIETQVKKNEIRLAMFLLEHNLPITVADHLVEFLKSCDQDSRKISRMSCSRTKCTAIINNVIGMSSFDSVVSLLRKNKFSLIIDESNDRSTTKHLVLVARMIVEGNVHDVFAGLLTPTDYTAEGIFNVIVDFFNTNEIPYRENLVGFASDGANVMMGGMNSVVTRFKSEIPNIFIQKCICHSLALCCSHACSMLPQDVESLVNTLDAMCTIFGTQKFCQNCFVYQKWYTHFLLDFSAQLHEFSLWHFGSFYLWSIGTLLFTNTDGFYLPYFQPFQERDADDSFSI